MLISDVTGKVPETSIDANETGRGPIDVSRKERTITPIVYKLKYRFTGRKKGVEVTRGQQQVCAVVFREGPSTVRQQESKAVELQILDRGDSHSRHQVRYITGTLQVHCKYITGNYKHITSCRYITGTGEALRRKSHGHGMQFLKSQQCRQSDSRVALGLS
jgi:hypothetical protein